MYKEVKVFDVFIFQSELKEINNFLKTKSAHEMTPDIVLDINLLSKHLDFSLILNKNFTEYKTLSLKNREVRLFSNSENVESNYKIYLSKKNLLNVFSFVSVNTDKVVLNYFSDPRISLSYEVDNKIFNIQKIVLFNKPDDEIKIENIQYSCNWVLDKKNILVFKKLLDLFIKDSKKNEKFNFGFKKITLGKITLFYNSNNSEMSNDLVVDSDCENVLNTFSIYFPLEIIYDYIKSLDTIVEELHFKIDNSNCLTLSHEGKSISSGRFECILQQSYQEY
jgi:hypothetical protein